MTIEIDHIVFDIGRVLIHYDPELAYLDLLPDTEERRWFLENVCTAQWNIEQDRGRDWADAEALLIERFPDHEMLIRAFRKNWQNMVPHAYETTVSVFEQLIAMGHDVTMLTNFASDTFKEAQEKFPFLKASRGVSVSGELKLIKPDPKIYDNHNRTFALDRSKTLFIDDSDANVAAARDYGWHTIHLTKPDDLPELLSNFSLK